MTIHERPQDGHVVKLGSEVIVRGRCLLGRQMQQCPQGSERIKPNDSVGRVNFLFSARIQCGKRILGYTGEELGSQCENLGINS